MKQVDICFMKQSLEPLAGLNRTPRTPEDTTTLTTFSITIPDLGDYRQRNCRWIRLW